VKKLPETFRGLRLRLEQQRRPGGHGGQLAGPSNGINSAFLGQSYHCRKTTRASYQTSPLKPIKRFGSFHAIEPISNNDYPQVDALKSLKAKDFLIDGEIAALAQDGRSSFQLLQSYGISKQTPLVYYVFDLLFLDGTDLRSRPLIE
jgi:hypothetical protein